MNKNIIFMGCRGYTANYGGWETFVRNLINNWNDKTDHFYVIELVHKKEEEIDEIVNGVHCIRIYVKQQGNIKMVLMDLYTMQRLNKIAQKYNLKNGVLYIMGARVGLLYWAFKNRLKKLNIKTIHNPAGLEWKRDKWNWATQKYIYYSHYFLAKQVDYLVCDSQAIADIYRKLIGDKNNIKYIAYGTYPLPVLTEDDMISGKKYLSNVALSENDYYLVLGRFVPENNYELIIREFMSSKTNKSLLIISNNESESKYYEALRERLHFEKDKRVIFAGTMYDKKVLAYVRKNAFAYIHGHSVGGTNPGLLEALIGTDLNILFDCPFNIEVGQDNAMYFSNEEGSLRNAMINAERLDRSIIAAYGQSAKNDMRQRYSWEFIVSEYAKLFNEM